MSHTSLAMNFTLTSPWLKHVKNPYTFFNFSTESCALHLQLDCHMLATELLAIHKTLHFL